MDTRPLAERPLPDQAFFLNVVIGMAKDAGYKTPEQFMRVVRFAWPHVKEPKTFNFDARDAACTCKSTLIEDGCPLHGGWPTSKARSSEGSKS